jgi:hypothetical protein
MYWHLQGMKCYKRTMFCHSRTRHFLSYKCQWFLDLCWSISSPGSASTPPRYQGTVWAPPGDECCNRTLFCHSRTGHFSHISVNGFWTCVGAFHLLEVPQHPLDTEALYGHLQEMKCCSRTLFCLAELGTLSHICVNSFWTCVGAFYLLKVPQQCLSTKGSKRIVLM